MPAPPPLPYLSTPHIHIILAHARQLAGACYIATNREHKLQMGANCQILVFTITLSKLNIECDQWHISGK